MTKVITKAEVKRNGHRNNLWVIIHDDVYDVTKFLEEHPGGEDTLLEVAGTDGTQAFEDVGHSEDARELLKKFKIGTLPAEEQSTAQVPESDSTCFGSCTKTLPQEEPEGSSYKTRNKPSCFRQNNGCCGCSFFDIRGCGCGCGYQKAHICGCGCGLHQLSCLIDDECICKGSSKMVKKDSKTKKGSSSGKSSCSECSSVASCLELNSKPPSNNTSKTWRDYDGSSVNVLVARGSRSTKFVTPSDKCDTLPLAASSSATKNIYADSDDESTGPCQKPNQQKAKPKKATKCTHKKKKGQPCDICGKSNKKWIIIAVLVLGAVAAGAIIYNQK